MLRSQRQIHQGLHRPIGAQQRVGQLKQRIRPGGQTAMEVSPEPGQHGERIDTGILIQQNQSSLSALVVITVRPQQRT
jgi:hypothetical protein